MTREEVKECIAVMQAYVDGKQIQINYDAGYIEWEDITDPVFNWDYHDYRIKPSPACRPFKDCEELVAEYCKRFGVERKAYEMPSVWVRTKNGHGAALAIVIDDWGLHRRDGGDSYAELCNKYTFLDGSPCGVMEEASDASSD